MQKVQAVNVDLSPFVDANANPTLHQMVAQMISDKVQVLVNENDQPASDAAAATQAAISGGHLTHAAVLMGAADFLIELKDTAVCNRDSQAFNQLRGSLGEARFDNLWAEGRRIPLESIATILTSLEAPDESWADSTPIGERNRSIPPASATTGPRTSPSLVLFKRHMLPFLTT